MIKCNGVDAQAVAREYADFWLNGDARRGYPPTARKVMQATLDGVIGGEDGGGLRGGDCGLKGGEGGGGEGLVTAASTNALAYRLSLRTGRYRCRYRYRGPLRTEGRRCRSRPRARTRVSSMEELAAGRS